MVSARAAHVVCADVVAWRDAESGLKEKISVNARNRKISAVLILGSLSLVSAATAAGAPAWAGAVLKHSHSIFSVACALGVAAIIMAFWGITECGAIAEPTTESQPDLAAAGHAALELISDWVITENGAGRVIFLNRAAREILGGLTEATAPAWEESWSPPSRAKIRQLREAVRAGQTPPPADCELIRPNGQLCVVEFTARPLQPAGVQWIGREVTALREMRSQLEHANTLLEPLLANSPDFIYFKDLKSRFVCFSRSFLNLFHIADPEQLKGKTDFDFFTEEHARPAFEDEQEIIRSGQPMIGKLEKETHPDGHTTWVLTTKMPWRNQAGTIIGTFGISKSITALKEAEARVEFEQEMLQTLLHNSPDSIFFKDRESRFVRISRSKVQKALKHNAQPDSPLRQKLGEKFDTAEPAADLLAGLCDEDITSAETARKAREDEQEIMRTGVPLIGKQQRQVQPDGKVTWSLVSTVPWRNTAGEIIGTTGISKDITALKEAEAQVEAIHKRLVDTSRLAGMAEVATDVLHNVGNVLNSVNVSCSLVLDRVQENNFANLARVPQILRENVGQLETFLTTDPRGKHLPDYLGGVAKTMEDQKAFLVTELNQLRRHIDHIKQIVTMQQNYAKVAGMAEVVNIPDLVDDALHMSAASLDRHDVKTQREIATLPAVSVDKHKVLQILVNLIRNAKYALTEADRPDKLMVLRAQMAGPNEFEISVIDNGAGIAPEHLQRIFAHGFTTRPDGHGFGLHSSALAARDLGGTLSVHSAGRGQGAAFTLKLPLTPQATRS